MKLAVYKLNESGRISRVHKLREDFDVEQAVNSYNSQNHGDKVEVVELNELELLLYNRAELDIRRYASEIENISCAVNSLCSSLDFLCNEVKRVRNHIK